jgi:DNA-binding Lrp family transcriptional regulator
MAEMSTVRLPVGVEDDVNAAILAVAEDRLEGFQRDPFAEIERLSGVSVDVVIERVRAMLEAGTIRRVRQTLMSTNLARGALVAWQVPQSRLSAAFEYMYQDDPFSGHVVIRSTDAATAGARYRLWTTLKVPQGFSLARHAEVLAERVGATSFMIMPARKLFALGVGHLRRRDLEPGSRSEEPATVRNTELVELSPTEWRVLTAMKREFEPCEIQRQLWDGRAAESALSVDAFCDVGAALARRGVIGRFSTFLEHVKSVADNEPVTRYNALFHWAVEPGREVDAGVEVGRHYVMTHAYWREAGPEFNNVNVMGVAHGLEKPLLLAHKAAIDKHLQEAGIPVAYTTVFWGGRSEIKPSEISPIVYQQWCRANGLAPETMRDTPTPAGGS